MLQSFYCANCKRIVSEEEVINRIYFATKEGEGEFDPIHIFCNSSVIEIRTECMRIYE